ncbi:MAG: ORF6N domain-containing protein [Proteobacteria bacterium]|nr:ORF6N domain-containing protein [Pseudomonadota bacterium]
MRIERIIITVRGQRVILDNDLAAIYGVTTKALNQAVKRNMERFPDDFAFKLDPSDVKENRSQFVTGSQKHRDPRFRPYAFTEHGALMAANVLRSARAVEMSVFVVRAFVRLRQWLADHAELSRRLDEMEQKYDSQFKVVFEAIRQLMTPPEPKKKGIGFHVREPRATYSLRPRRK